MRGGIIRLAFLFMCLLTASSAQASSCSASNEVGDTCSISCSTGEAAVCKQGNGSSAPECYCDQDNLYQPKDETNNLIQRYGLQFFDEESSKNASPILESKRISNFSSEVSTPDSRSKIIQDLPAISNARLSQLRDFHLDESCGDVVVGRTCFRTPPKCIPVSFNPLFPDVRIWNAVVGCSWYPGHEICREQKSRQCSPVMGKLTIGNTVTIIGEPTAVYKTPTKAEVPISFLQVEETIDNCSPTESAYTFTHQENVSVGQVFKKSNVVRTGTTFSIKLGLKAGVEGLGDVTAETSIGASKDVTITDGEDLDLKTQETVTRMFPVKQAPYSISFLKHTFVKRVVPIPYSGKVLIDAPVNPNREGIVNLSQILSEDQRTFEFGGVIEDSSVSNGRFSIQSKVYTPEECDAKARELNDRQP